MSDLDTEHNRSEDDLVGADRDGARLASTLTLGTSVVIVGTLGSGKSHLVRETVVQLRRAGADPLVLRSGGPLKTVAFGAFDAAHDPRVESLRTGSAPEGAAPIVVVDDAQELDEDSAAALVRAVYGGYATAVFAITITRDGSPAATPGATGAAQMLVDLWLRGIAERVDLNELTTADAEELLVQFGGGDLDALSRATVIGLADGSRMLLREFSREAVVAAAHGRDPITAIRESRPHGRLSDVVAAHVAQLSVEERRTLALLGRVPRIAFAEAVRLVPVDALEQLVQSKLVYDDGTVDRLLTANSALARAADRAGVAADVDASLARAAERMLAPEADWWSVPIARRLASEWLRGEQTVPAISELDEETRLRIALDAARNANDTGESDLAASIARWGVSIRPDLALRIELALADAGRGAPIDVQVLLDDIAAEPLECVEMLRWIRMSGPLIRDHATAARDAIASATMQAACADPVFAAEIDLIRLQMSALTLTWDAALPAAVELSARMGTSASVRMRASVVAGLCHASLGDSAEASRWFQRAVRLAGDRDGTTPTTTQERLWAFSSEILAHGIAGTDARATLTRLEEEYAAAALEGDPATGSFVGLIAAAAAAAIGDVDRAEHELRASMRRLRPPQFGPIVAYTEMVVARALALQGRAGDARSVLDLADTSLVEGVPLLDHARLTAEACVLAAEGHDADALRRVREATVVAESAPALLARDLFQLLALGDTDEAILPQIRHLAETTSVPVTRVLNDRARDLVAERPGDPRVKGLEALKLSAVWGVGDGQRDWMRRISLPPRAGGGGHGAAAVGAVHELTRREREIAILVAEGLSNREVATRLYLSVRTVESHIYQARAKVDARSRGDLGRLVAQAAARHN